MTSQNPRPHCASRATDAYCGRRNTKSNRESVPWARCLLSRPAGTLSSTSGGGEGRGEEERYHIPPTFTEKWYRAAPFKGNPRGKIGASSRRLLPAA